MTQQTWCVMAVLGAVAFAGCGQTPPPAPKPVAAAVAPAAVVEAQAPQPVTDSAATPPPIDALRAALVNLALNGIDAAGRGGLVRLSAFARDGAAVLAIDDSGEGPPQDLRDTMHEPFVTGKPEGIGLGLTVARAVALATTRPCPTVTFLRLILSVWL